MKRIALQKRLLLLTAYNLFKTLINANGPSHVMQKLNAHVSKKESNQRALGTFISGTVSFM